jgi:predicted transcriptional regulator
MDFKTAATLGTYLSKDYAEDFFALLVTYQDISASEAASRLGLHIRTAQDFLEGLASLAIVSKREVSEGKRPYFRYTLEVNKITMEIDLSPMQLPEPAEGLERRIRERLNAGARFPTARGDGTINRVVIWTGEGRERREHTIKLSPAQGRFLYHLPFPTAKPLSIADIMTEADVDEAHAPEVLDIVQLLENYGVIEAL